MHKEIEQSSEKYRVLVVDDDKLLNQLICTHLENEDFLTISAFSLKEAKNTIESGHAIDIIFLDYQLDDGDGVDFLKFNEVFPYIERSPVIMISANDHAEFLEACFYHGASDYIIKPVNFKLLSLKAKSLIESVKLKNVIKKQNEELSKYKTDSMREEVVAKFTYEYLVRQCAQQVPGISIWLKPYSAFSGDAVLVSTSPTGSLFIIMVDATGHGLSAAITIMPLITTFNSMVSKGFHLQSIMAEINRKLVVNTPDDRFVAAVGIEINKISKELFVWNGGMPSVYVLNNAEITRRFKSRHLALGILEDDLFDSTVEEVSLNAKDTIFLCSDGLLEQANSIGEHFSKERLVDLLQKNEANLLDSIVIEFNKHVDGATYTDDVSMCLVDVDKYYPDALRDESGLHVESYKKDSKFIWDIKICGDRLRNCEIIPLVQHVLQHMHISQSLSQKALIVASEMLNNAIDHGVLELPSSLKELENGFNEYHKEREQRLINVKNHDFVELFLSCENKNSTTEILVRVKDSGKGYAFCVVDKTTELLNSGRGLQLINVLSRSVDIKSPGNIIEAVLV